MSMCKIWSLCKKLWWLFAAFVSALAIFLFRRKEKAESVAINDAIHENPVSFTSIAKQRVDQALIDARVDSALIQKQSSAKRKELQDIQKDKDEKARLDKLASYLEQNL